MSDFPHSRSDHLSAIVQNQMLVWGGKNEVNDQFFSHDILWSLDLVTNTWSERRSFFETPNDLPHESAGSRIAIVRNSDIYQFGGGYCPPHSSTWEYFNDVHKLNGITLEWKRIFSTRPLPGARDACGLCALGGKLVVFGGGRSEIFYNDVWIFSLREKRWSLLECCGNKPLRRFGHTFTAIDNNRAVLIGGRLSTKNLSDSYIFKLDAKEWIKVLLSFVPNIPAPRFGHSALFVNAFDQKRYIFVFWGYRVSSVLLTTAVVIDLATMKSAEIYLTDVHASSRQTVCAVHVQSEKVHFIRFGGRYEQNRIDFPIDKLEWEPGLPGVLSSIDANEPSPSSNIMLEKNHFNGENYEISSDDFEFDELNDFISAGSFGEVYKAKMKSNGDTAALKIFFKKRRTSDESQLLNKEAKVLMNIKPHFHIVRLIGICDTIRCYALLMEFICGGDLTQLLESSDPLVERWLNRVDISYQVASGMAHLHKNSPPVIHLDLKSNNVLIDILPREQRPFICKICDFGLSKMSGVSSLSKSRKSDEIPGGTVAYIAPERYQIIPYESEESEERREVAKKSDVFSYGVLLWEIRERKRPFRGTEPMVVHFHIKSGKGLPEGRFVAPDGFDVLAKDSSASSPADRPSFVQITSKLGKILRDPACFDHTLTEILFKK